VFYPVQALLANTAGLIMGIGEICNRHAVIIGKSDSIYSAAILMRDRHVHYVVVVESNDGNNIPVGAVTDRDIVVNMIAKKVDLNAVVIGEVMNSQLLLANEQDDVMTTLKRMRNKRIRYTPVVNADSALIGVLSIDDILDRLTEQLNDIDYIISREQAVAREDVYEKQ
jgi:CBS domain-containing protein